MRLAVLRVIDKAVFFVTDSTQCLPREGGDPSFIGI